MIFVAEIQQCTSTASLDRLNLGTIPYGALHKGSRKAAKASPKTTPRGGGDIEMEFNIRPSTTKNPAANGDKRTGHRHTGTAPPPAARQDRTEVGHHQRFQHALILLLILTAMRQSQKPQRA